MTSFICLSKVVEKVVDKVVDKVGDKHGEKVGDKLSINQQKILALIVENAWVTAQSISTIIGISKRKTEENISKLKAMEKIKRIGSARGGHWEIVRNEL